MYVYGILLNLKLIAIVYTTIPTSTSTAKNNSNNFTLHNFTLMQL